MAMPKRKSRRIEVEGTRYRWRKAGCICIDRFKNIQKLNCMVLIEEFENPASKLVARVSGTLTEGLIWDSCDLVIYPGQVRLMIIEALQRGWQPQQRGFFDLGVVYETPAALLWEKSQAQSGFVPAWYPIF